MYSQLFITLLLYALIVTATIHNGIPPREDLAITTTSICSQWSPAVSFCESATPNFLSLAPLDQYYCLCEELQLFSNFIEIYSSCLSWVSAQTTNSGAVLIGTCASAGNDLSSPKTTQAITTQQQFTSSQTTTAATTISIVSAPVSTFTSGSDSGNSNTNTNSNSNTIIINQGSGTQGARPQVGFSIVVMMASVFLLDLMA